MTSDHVHLKDLLHRFARLVAAEGWEGDLNPTQRAALLYLARANRFSRAPSHVADYLSATRGTVSQTLKALQRKGFIRERRSETDKRSFSYELTREGIVMVSAGDGLSAVLAQLSSAEAADFADKLAQLIAGLLEEREGRAFGVCRTCFYHNARGKTGFCTLLQVEIGEQERDQLCHEHAKAEAA